jgi:hypothetical protein
LHRANGQEKRYLGRDPPHLSEFLPELELPGRFQPAFSALKKAT